MHKGPWMAAAAAAVVVAVAWAQGQNGPPGGGPGAGPGQGQRPQGPDQNRPGNQHPGQGQHPGSGHQNRPEQGAGGQGPRPGAGDQNRPGNRPGMAAGQGPGAGHPGSVHRPAHRPGSGSQYRPGGPRPSHHFLSQGRWRPSIRGPAYRYPPGYGYRLWATGAILPRLFLSPAYYYNDYALLGLEPPPPGYRWLRYGPDLLLVQVFTGRIADVVQGVFY